MTDKIQQARRAHIYGVGINDFKGAVCITETVNGKSKVVWRCKIYNAWVHMLARCYSGTSLARRPRYAGCSVSDEWLLFSNFRNWMAEQDHEGMHLDKDILAP